MRNKLYDHSNKESLAAQARKKRFELFKSLLNSLERPVRILDVGGTEGFWRSMDFIQEPGIEITLLNIQEIPTTLPNFTSLQGDARSLSQFADKSFHIAFSNSVIEHVGGPQDQRAMADEIKRVAQWHFVQTPNRYFPIEPHFVFPMFQFLPTGIKVWLIRHFDLGWRKKCSDLAEARESASSIRLLSGTEFRSFFPQSQFYEEKMFGLTKSFIAYTMPS